MRHRASIAAARAALQDSASLRRSPRATTLHPRQLQQDRDVITAAETNRTLWQDRSRSTRLRHIAHAAMRHLPFLAAARARR